MHRYVYISREIIPNIGTGYFHGESTSVRAGKIYSIIIHYNHRAALKNHDSYGSAFEWERVGMPPHTFSSKTLFISVFYMNFMSIFKMNAFPNLKSGLVLVCSDAQNVQ